VVGNGNFILLFFGLLLFLFKRNVLASDRLIIGVLMIEAALVLPKYFVI